MIIDINKALCPYQFDIQLDGTTYTMEIRYNNEFDYFTVDLSVGEETIINGEKILYGKELFHRQGQARANNHNGFAFSQYGFSY